LNELALFAGAGGGILGGKLLGWRTVCAVERDAYAASILAQRQNDGLLEPFPIWADVCSFDEKPWRGIVDVVSGGFPCQDISAAGKGAGIEGARSGLWVEMARIIGEVRPAHVFVENSPVLTSRGLGRVIGDLATLGFDAQWGVIAASDVGAPHERREFGLWPTPCTPNGGRTNRPDDIATRGLRPDGRKVQISLESAAKNWSTPLATDGEKGGPNQKFSAGGQPLATQAAQWATPTARDHFPPHSPEYIDRKRAQGHGMRNLNDEAALHGIPGKSSSDTTEPPGSLNPEFHLWLMGWPTGWTALEPLATDKYRSAPQQLGVC
jgi:site-specific DNA-cytosine methylase